MKKADVRRNKIRRMLLRMMLLFCFVNVLFTADTANAAARGVWKVLWLNVDTVKFQGREVSMTKNDYIQSGIMKRRFETFVEEATKDSLDLQIYEETLTKTVKTLTYYKQFGYAVYASDIEKELDKYFKKRKYDSVIVTARMDGIPTEYWGLTWEAHTYSNKAGYSFIHFLDGEDTSWYMTPTAQNPYPEEVYVHEFLHQVINFYRNNGMGMPDLDKPAGYGYYPLTQIGYNGYYQWYRDIFTQKVWDSKSKSYLGVPSAEWIRKPSSGLLKSCYYASSGHKFSSWKPAKKATALKTGTKTRKCSVCKRTETKVIQKLKPTMKLSAKNVTLKKGKTKTIKVTKLAKGDGVKNWTVEDKNIASVSKKGKIKAKKKGTTTVIVTLKSGKQGKIKVMVK